MAELVDAAAAGLRPGLEALRNRLARVIEQDEGPLTAALSRQLRDVLRELDELEKVQGRKGSVVDELADRRKDGRSGTEGGAAARRRRPNLGA